MNSAFFAGYLTVEHIDIIACILLASAAFCRARVLGARVMGAVILGCMCGLCAPLSRELLLHGSAGARIVLQVMPEAALAGAACAALLLVFCENKSYKVFFWLDAISIGLAGCTAACVGIFEAGIVGTLVLGMICGLGPGLLRDISLGDTAMIIEREWYAASAALGIMATITLLLWLPGLDFPGKYLPISSIAAGIILVIIIRYWKRAVFAE